VAEGSLIVVLFICSSLFFFIVVFDTSSVGGCSSWSVSAGAAVGSLFSSLCLVCFGGDIFTGVYPVRVDIYSSREIVDAGLEALATDLAVKVANAALLVELNRDGLFMIAEEACEGGGENLALRQPWSVSLKTLRDREHLPSSAQRASWNSCACPVLY
jgi:hypothetical protein